MIINWKESIPVENSCQQERCKSFVTDVQAHKHLIMGGLSEFYGSSISASPGRFRCYWQGQHRNTLDLEVEANLRSHRSRRHVVSSAKGGEKVVQDIIVCQVDHRQPRTPLVTVAVEEVVISQRDVKQISLLNSRWIVIVVFLVDSRYGNQRGTKLRSRTVVWQGRRGGRVHTVARKSSFELLIGGKGNSTDVRRDQADVWHAADEHRTRAIVVGFHPVAGRGASHQTAVIPPIESNPRKFFLRLILQVRGLVETFVVIDAENSRGCRGNGARE